MTRRQMLLYLIEHYYTRDEAAHYIKDYYRTSENAAYSFLNYCPVHFPHKLAQQFNASDL